MEWRAIASPGGQAGGGPSLPLTVSGLSAGATYTFTVTATNAAGTGPASAPSNPITTSDVPGAPTLEYAIPDPYYPHSAIRISFEPPSKDGGGITGYTAVVNPIGRRYPVSPYQACLLSMLDPGTYTVSVYASNSAGDGPAAQSSPVTL